MQQGSDRPANSNKIRVGYIGLTCEAPIFSAVEKGFFKEEGLEVELVKCDWKNYKDVLALGGYDITHHLIMYFLKPMEQGLDVKIHRRNPSRLFARAGGGEWPDSLGQRFEGQTHRRAGNGNAAIYFCQSRARREWN